MCFSHYCFKLIKHHCADWCMCRVLFIFTFICWWGFACGHQKRLCGLLMSRICDITTSAIVAYSYSGSRKRILMRNWMFLFYFWINTHQTQIIIPIRVFSYILKLVWSGTLGKWSNLSHDPPNGNIQCCRGEKSVCVCTECAKMKPMKYEPMKDWKVLK